MSAGDLKTDGLKGNNFPWQLKMLKGLQGIIDAITSNITILNPQVRTPTLIRPNNTSGVISAFVKSISFACPTSASAESYISTDGGVTTIALYPGETVHYDAGALNNSFTNTDFTYDTTGSELLISYIV